MERMNDACDPVLDFEYFFSSLRSGPLLAISAIYQDYAWRLESEKKSPSSHTMNHLTSSTIAPFTIFRAGLCIVSKSIERI